MAFRRRSIVRLLLSAGTLLLIGRAARRVLAAGGQEQAPNRREFAVQARNYGFTPNRIEVTLDDLVKISLRSEDQPHSFTIDEYRVARRIPAGGAATLEFRADRPGTFPFYCSITTDPGCRAMRGELVVKAK